MAMKRCPVCGEKYSDTYKTCPFCEEEALWEEEEEYRRPSKNSKRSAHGLQYNLITPTLIVLILMMAILLVYLLFGDKISQSIGGKKDDDKTDIPSTQQPVEPNPGGTQPSNDPNASGGDEDTDPENPENPGGVMPEGSGGNESSGGSSGESGGTSSGTWPGTLRAGAARVTNGGSGGVRVRSGPGTSYDPLATLTNGSSVEIVEWSGTDDWYKLTFRDSSGSTVTGYMKEEYLANGSGSSGSSSGGSSGTSSSGGSSSSGTSSSGTSSGGLRAGSAVVVNGGNGVRVRSGPGTSYDSLATIPNGGSVQIVESAGSGWYKITFSDIGGVTTTGYMKGEYLSNQ